MIASQIAIDWRMRAALQCSLVWCGMHSGPTTLRSVTGLTPPRKGAIALQLADRVYIIDHGTVVFEGTPDKLRADQQVTATYLGVGG
jgi:hypothetical protein